MRQKVGRRKAGEGQKEKGRPSRPHRGLGPLPFFFPQSVFSAVLARLIALDSRLVGFELNPTDTPQDGHSPHRPSAESSYVGPQTPSRPPQSAPAGAIG